jgi:hypothetical protein
VVTWRIGASQYGGPGSTGLTSGCSRFQPLQLGDLLDQPGFVGRWIHRHQHLRFERLFDYREGVGQNGY